MDPVPPGSYSCAFMLRPSARRLVPFAALAWLAACAGSPPPANHSHTITTTVTVTNDALLPGASVAIPAMSTVVWRNRSTNDLEIRLDTVACPQCDTVFGFVPNETSAHSTTIRPGAVATLCFHSPGSFPFVARLGDKEHRGTIEVGAPR